MNGCRNLTSDEVRKVINSFSGRYENRNRLLFVLGISTGFRISELLSIKVSDVWDGDRVLGSVRVQAKNTKTKEGREMRLNSSAKKAIQQWIDDPARPESEYLFSSRKGGAISRQQAHDVLKQAFEGLDGTLATHTMRKTFATRLMDHPDIDIHKVSRYLGHKNVEVTERYLGIETSKDAEYMESIAVEF